MKPYKGYTSSCEWDDLDIIYYGKIQGITDGVSYHAETKPELQKAFEEAVDDYIETCAKVGKEPQKPVE